MSDGSQQDRRCPPGLNVGAVPIDGRTLTQLVADARVHARSLAFFDSPGNRSGDWGRLFDHNETAVLAAGLAIDAAAIEAEFLDHFGAARDSAMAAQVDALATQLAAWLATLADLDHPQDPTFAEGIERRIAPLLPDGWRDRTLVAVAPAGQRAHFFALLNALRSAQASARTQFTASLDSGAQAPSTALLLVCSQVYQRIQSRLNDFQGRHLDFYYRDVLRLQQRAAIPDEVHLVFRRDPKFADEVIIAAGQVFAAGKAPDGLPVAFAAVDPLIVTDATVAMIRMLRFDRSDRIAPENLLQFVTSAESFEFANAPQPGKASCPIFGVTSGGQAARIGLAVSSPILWLARGDRHITVTIEMAVGALQPMLDRFAAARTADLRRDIFGHLLMHWLFCDAMTEADTQTVRAAWDAARSDDDIAWQERIVGDALFDQFLPPPSDGAAAGGAEHAGRRKPVAPIGVRRALARDALIATLFTCQLSTAQGWFGVGTIAAITDLPASGSETGALGLRMAISPEDPAVVACTAVHGAEWPATAPVLRLLVNPNSRLFALSLLDKAVLTAIKIDVEVKGVNDLLLANQFGQLDPSKPFEPFGASPDPVSYLIVGSSEAARKSVVKFDLAFDWTGLPETGLAAHYDAYGQTPGDYADAGFKLLPSLLRGGRWLPVPPERSMFDTGGNGVAVSHQVVSIDRSALARSWLRTEIPAGFDQQALNGFVKLELSGPRHCFGHGDYPGLLIAAMRSNPRRKAPLPRPPYTPRLARIALDYAATTRITVGVEPGNEAILHLHPFGTRTIHPVIAGHVPSVLPHFAGDGQLLIGISASDLCGELTLLFELDPDAAGPADDELSRRRPPVWSWLAQDSWTTLPGNRVLVDATKGFLSSGIVKLNLPAGLTRDNSILPGELFWLRVSSDLPSRSFAGLTRISAQAMVARRMIDPRTPLDRDTPLPPGTITTRSATLPGVLGIAQPQASFGLRPAESPLSARTRMAERLRHRQRAVTAWDYERLVLEEFPMVYKVKCLANVRQDGEAAPGENLAIFPGSVLLVVVPALSSAQRTTPLVHNRAVRLPADVLERIELFVQALASPHARVRVVNASYEFIQVRCSVELGATNLRGTVLTRINEAITRHLSPWCDAGAGAAFDWQLRCADLEACVRAVAAVQGVSGLSLMRVWKDDRHARPGEFRLDDTGRSANALCRSDAIQACRPWSLALPLADHIVVLAHDQGDRPSVPTGIAASALATAGAFATPGNIIAGLEIGETMIL